MATAFSPADHIHMARALALAENGRTTTTPNPSVGCVLVNADGIVIGEGWSQPAGQNHAEIQALKDAQTRGHDPKGATAYVTLEPCSHYGRTPPCCNALIAAGLARVVVAIKDPNPEVAGQGLERLRAAGIAIETGLMADAARESLAGFLSRMERGRPFVRLKIAASLDGKTALANGESKWITGAAARTDVQHWRARACATLTGSGTVLTDDPQLNVRIATPRQPLRIVLDSALRTPTAARVLQQDGALLVHASTDEARMTTLRSAGARLLHLPDADGRVDLHALLAHLGSGLRLNEVLVEAGATLNAAFIASGLVDEYLIYLAPALLGDPARGMAALPAFTRLDQRIVLRFLESTLLGEDLRIRAQPARLDITAS